MFFKKIKKILLLIGSIFPTIVFAANSLHIPGYNPSLTYNTQNSDLSKFLTAFYKLALGLAGIAAVVVFIIAGILYITAGGNTNKETRAKDHISNAITGLLIILLAFLILATVNPKLAKVTLPSLPSINPTSVAGGIDPSTYSKVNSYSQNYSLGNISPDLYLKTNSYQSTFNGSPDTYLHTKGYNPASSNENYNSGANSEFGGND